MRTAGVTPLSFRSTPMFRGRDPGLAESAGPHPGRHGLAIDGRGSVYLVDAFNHRIQNFAVDR
jgi:hypothetical protein